MVITLLYGTGVDFTFLTALTHMLKPMATSHDEVLSPAMKLL